MADVLLNKVINDEINLDLFIKWLLRALPQCEERTKEILSCNVAQIDFVTYFINFIHEEAPCNNKMGDTPQKIHTPKRIDKTRTYGDKEDNKTKKTNLFGGENNRTPKQNDSSNSVLNSYAGKFSTPKVTKTSFSPSSYFSPISPLYQKESTFSSKENKIGNGERKSADKYSLCLGDFIVSNTKSSSKKKRLSNELTEKKEVPRRIKPTSICTKPVNAEFQKTENSFNFRENIEEVPVISAIEQRNALVIERMEILSRKDSTEKNSRALLTKRHNSISKQDITPSLSEVIYKTHLDYVATIYITILEYKMVLNVTSEIYFLISLLLSKQTECSYKDSRNFVLDTNFIDSNLGVKYLNNSRNIAEYIENNDIPDKRRLYNSEIFENIHNVLYFAVRCLEAQIEIIRLYDKTIIRLLADNERIKSFSHPFSRKLLKLAEEKAERSCIEVVTQDFQSNVCFNIDTDNNQNYPDQTSFHAFRKQRDLFYDILRIWETYHLSSDWLFSVRLGGKLRTLFSLTCEPTNYMHLARLFKNQLLSSCAKGPKEQGLSETNVSFLPSVAIDADKLKRLTNRLVTKQASNGINSVPVFTGYQEFYRDFILAASNYFFNKHLCDNFISEIVELNDTKFSGIDVEEVEENDVDPNIRKQYVNCVKNLRILAKFLGFLDSLPYRSEFPLSKNILESQIEARSEYSPALDIKRLLNKAIEKNTIVLLLPWLTKYLAMLDYVTIRLPYYTSIHKILFHIYRTFENSDTNNYNKAVVQFCLGWLFELPNFPYFEYFNFCLVNIDTSYKNCPMKSTISDVKNGTKVKMKNKNLDYLNIVNQSVLYLCCPYLEEIKKLLSMNAACSNVSVKYITPVTAVESNNDLARKKLEQLLEDAFFSSQPASVRKTIEFISERIASTAVKYICHDLVPKAKEEAVKDLKENLLKYDCVDKDADDGERKVQQLRKLTAAMAQAHISKFLEMYNQEMEKISLEKIPSSLDSLLPIDTLEETKNVCVQIATKMYRDRVKQWVNSHVNLTVFSKDFDSELQKALNGRQGEKDKAPFILPAGGRNCTHNENSLSGFHLLNNVREACCDLIEEEIEVNEDFILNLLRETYKSLSERNDINDMISMSICHTLFDLCLLLVSKVPAVFSTNDIVTYFTKIWGLQQKTYNLFKSLFCPRNIKILQKSSNCCEAWDGYAKIISRIMDEKLVEQEDLESQCTGFYNRDWDQDTLENFSNFLKKFISYGQCDTAESSFAYLLDFLSDFCSDL